jgi:hypothetical protein
VIDTASLGSKRAEFADLNGNGHMDVVAASFDDKTIAWYENNGSQVFTKRIISTNANGAYFVHPVDIDGDGDLDLLTASQFDNTIAWYENLGGGNFAFRPIDTFAMGARTVVSADVNGDGSPDVLAASVDNNKIALHLNDGSGNFTAHVVDQNALGAYSVFGIDMDGDGDIDILSASRNSGQIAIHRHIRSHLVGVEMGGLLVIDNTILLTVDDEDGPEGIIYTITEAPSYGELQLDGSPVPQGGSFTQNDVNNGRLAYQHDGDDLTVDGFRFQVHDSTGSGVAPATGRFTISIHGTGGAIVHLPLDEGSGTVAGDISGLGNDGVLVNGATFAPESGDGSPYSVQFDGVDDRIDLGGLDVNGSGLSLAAWFKAESFPGPSGDPRLISKASGLNDIDHYFMLSTIKVGSDVRLRARLRIGGTTTTLVASSGNLVTGEWHHATMTYDGATLRLYLDGVQVGSMALSGAVATNPGVNVSVGGQPAGAGGRNFHGYLDDIRILERALSPFEIAEIVNSQTVIDVWYGNAQSFGEHGDPQEWINILGNVSSHPGKVSSLTYSLNGGPNKNLSLGPDGFRLERAGDFNIDIHRSELASGLNTVLITASDSLGNQTVVLVEVNYQAGNVWPLPYSIDWSTAASIQEVAQVVDGLWTLEEDGVRTVETGYDRLIAIGDIQWQNYEVQTTVTIHAVDMESSGGSAGDPALGLLVRWTGHTDDPIPGMQPKAGFIPYGAIGWWRWSSLNSARLEFYGTGTSKDYLPALGVPYTFKMRVETLPGGQTEYHAKAWVSGQAEPPSWDLGYSVPSGLGNGSFMLLAHFVDATFGDVFVSPVAPSGGQRGGSTFTSERTDHLGLD